MAEDTSRSAEIVRIPLDPQARLRGALRMLETRLDQQRASIATWRDALGGLRVVSRELREGAEACQISVDQLAGRLTEARRAVATLDRTADRLAEAAIG